MTVPISKLERLSKLSIYSLATPPDKPETDLSDARLGIEQESYSGWRREGELQEYHVPSVDSRRFTFSEMRGYRAAFSVIAPDLNHWAN